VIKTHSNKERNFGKNVENNPPVFCNGNNPLVMHIVVLAEGDNQCYFLCDLWQVFASRHHKGDADKFACKVFY